MTVIGTVSRTFSRGEVSTDNPLGTAKGDSTTHMTPHSPAVTDAQARSQPQLEPDPWLTGSQDLGEQPDFSRGDAVGTGKGAGGTGGAVDPSPLPSRTDGVSSSAPADTGENSQSWSVDDSLGSTSYSIDTWLDELLREDEQAASPSTEASTPGGGRPASSVYYDPWDSNEGERARDTGDWSLPAPRPADPDAPGTSTSYLDDETGDSEYLQKWKSQAGVPVNGMAAPAEGWRSRGSWGGDRGQGGGREQGRGRGIYDDTSTGEMYGGGRHGVGSDSREGSWGRGRATRGGRGGGRGRRRRDEWEEARPLDPTEAAQRAVVSDLESLRKQGRWEDVIRALVSARVRGLTVNARMYNG